MPRDIVGRRGFLKVAAAAGTGALIPVTPAWARESAQFGPETMPPPPDYQGPNVVIVRFGGGARRRETIDPEHTYSPFLCHELARQGTLFPRMEIDSLDGVETSHGQGTLYILTGKYDKFKDFEGKFLGSRFEAKVPTLFEYLRKSFNVPDHQALIVNGEDRTDEEFYTFSNHHLFGVNYRSNVLSLYRFKLFLLRQQLANGRWRDEQRAEKQAELEKLEALDYRRTDDATASPEMEAFWEDWRRFYGESGLVNPRGDRVLTELTIRAIRELRPKLLMVNYNDCDYVHWGNLTHYTRGVAIMDAGLRQIHDSLAADPEYRDNTILIVVPDCGRDNNRFLAVPCQHHFGSRSSHEIFALLVGPGIPRDTVVDRRVDQTSVAATVGRLMGFETAHAEGPVLEEAFA